ncbi:unnamed protein product, partial [marine sediment metagenome]
TSTVHGVTHANVRCAYGEAVAAEEPALQDGAHRLVLIKK